MTHGIDDRNVKDELAQPVDSRLLAVLVCPVTKGRLSMTRRTMN